MNVSSCIKGERLQILWAVCFYSGLHWQHKYYLKAAATNRNIYHLVYIILYMILLIHPDCSPLNDCTVYPFQPPLTVAGERFSSHRPSRCLVSKHPTGISESLFFFCSFERPETRSCTWPYFVFGALLGPVLFQHLAEFSCFWMSVIDIVKELSVLRRRLLAVVKPIWSKTFTVSQPFGIFLNSLNRLKMMLCEILCKP